MKNKKYFFDRKIKIILVIEENEKQLIIQSYKFN